MPSELFVCTVQTGIPHQITTEARKTTHTHSNAKICSWNMFTNHLLTVYKYSDSLYINLNQPCFDPCIREKTLIFLSTPSVFSSSLLYLLSHLLPPLNHIIQSITLKKCMCRLSELRLPLLPLLSLPLPPFLPSSLPPSSLGFSPFSRPSYFLFCVWMEKLGSPEPAHPSPGSGPVAGESVAKTAGLEGDEAAAAVSSKLFRCACVRRWIPLVYREELYQVLRLAGPLVSRGKLKCWWRGRWGLTHLINVFLYSWMCTVIE